MSSHQHLVDLNFFSLCDPQAVFGSMGTPENREKIIDLLSYGKFELPDSIFEAPNSQTSNLVRRAILMLQATARHLLGCLAHVERDSEEQRSQLQRVCAERDELFEEVVDLREALHYMRTESRALIRGRFQDANNGCSSSITCRICGNVYPSAHVLQSHMRKRHSSTSPNHFHANAAAQGDIARDAAHLSAVRSEVSMLKQSIQELLVSSRLQQELQRGRQPTDGLTAEAMGLIKSQQQRMDSLERLLMETTMSPLLNRLRREDLERTPAQHKQHQHHGLCPHSGLVSSSVVDSTTVSSHAAQHAMYEPGLLQHPGNSLPSAYTYADRTPSLPTYSVSQGDVPSVLGIATPSSCPRPVATASAARTSAGQAARSSMCDLTPGDTKPPEILSTVAHEASQLSKALRRDLAVVDHARPSERPVAKGLRPSNASDAAKAGGEPEASSPQQLEDLVKAQRSITATDMSIPKTSGQKPGASTAASPLPHPHTPPATDDKGRLAPRVSRKTAEADARSAAARRAAPSRRLSGAEEELSVGASTQSGGQQSSGTESTEDRSSSSSTASSSRSSSGSDQDSGSSGSGSSGSSHSTSPPPERKVTAPVGQMKKRKKMSAPFMSILTPLGNSK